MDSNVLFFSLPFGDADTDDFASKSQFHHALPSESLLDADDDFMQFLSTDDPLEEPDFNGPTTLHCEICQKKFDNAKKYYGHLRVHSKDNLWTCDKCPNQKFSTKQQLMKHSLTHKPLEKVWRCLQCSKAFEALYRLQQHLFATHLNYRPHKCNVCKKTFQKLSDLKKHQNQHTGFNEYTCPICKRGFKDKSNLGRHMLTHTDQKNYQCTGCKRKFKQMPSLKRHIKICPKYVPTVEATTNRLNCRICKKSFQYRSALLEHCVREHTNTNDKDNKKEERLIQNRTENESAVETIVDDILSVEDEYSIAHTTPNEIINFDKNQTYDQTETSNADNLMHIEFLKEINQLHTLDDELFYNDIDFETFHSNQAFNPNDIDCASQEKNEIFFDLADHGWSMDQDLMNSLYQVKTEILPDELLNPIPDVTTLPQTSSKRETGILEDPVSINECATIFESDIDLDASTNLAMNLNQLISENNVQFVSTEDDDTFIISLDSGIDAEKLSDILNNGVEHNLGDNSHVKKKLVENLDDSLNGEKSKLDAMDVKEIVMTYEIITNEILENKIDENTLFENEIVEKKIIEKGVIEKEIVQKEIGEKNIAEKESVEKETVEKDIVEKAIVEKETVEKDIVEKAIVEKDIVGKAIVEKDIAEKEIVKCEEIKENNVNKMKNETAELKFVCKTCGKIFNRKNNWRSHLGIHDVKLRKHVCHVCGERFSYRSSLNKHRVAAHEPRVFRAHTCMLCNNHYKQAWILKNHLERDHDGIKPYACDTPGCNRQFYKKFDLDVHKRSHTGEKKYSCDKCGKTYGHISHLKRHSRSSRGCKKPDQTNETVYECDKCGSTSRCLSKFKRHSCRPKDYKKPLAKLKATETSFVFVSVNPWIRGLSDQCGRRRSQI